MISSKLFGLLYPAGALHLKSNGNLSCTALSGSIGQIVSIFSKYTGDGVVASIYCCELIESLPRICGSDGRIRLMVMPYNGVASPASAEGCVAGTVERPSVAVVYFTANINIADQPQRLQTLEEYRII